MKKLVLLVCIFALLIAATGAVSAHNPQPDQFTITGYTTSYDYRTLANDRTTVFNVTAAGESTGYLEGPFTFKEVGSVDFNPETGQGSGNGANTGALIITKKNDPNSEVAIWFGGKSTFTTVSGTWKVLRGKGVWRGLKGQGEYTGDAGYPGYPFSVTFTGTLTN
jgi:hypothetical protein